MPPGTDFCQQMLATDPQWTPLPTTRSAARGSVPGRRGGPRRGPTAPSEARRPRRRGRGLAACAGRAAPRPRRGPSAAPRTAKPPPHALEHQQRYGVDHHRFRGLTRKPVVTSVGTRSSVGQGQQPVTELGVQLGEAVPAGKEVVQVHDPGTVGELRQRRRQGGLARPGRTVDADQPTPAQRRRASESKLEDHLDPVPPEDGLDVGHVVGLRGVRLGPRAPTLC